MINVNFDALLNEMGKAQIMAMLEGQLDTAIAQKIERENADRLYKQAKANVANDTYTADDLIVLQKRLNDIKRGKIAAAPAKEPVKTFETKVVTLDEANDILKRLGIAKPEDFFSNTFF